jgi:hypothetical protein
MRIWTIQTKAAWDTLMTEGILRARAEHQSTDWPGAYAWMRDQMIRRIGLPPLPDAAPLWGWHRWLNKTQPRPDLRSIRHYWHPPGPYVLIECDLPCSAVVLSDFSAWHLVLNNRYVSVSEEDDEAYEAEMGRYRARPDDSALAALGERLHKSWERVIDMDALAEPYWHGDDKRSIQACFWQISRDQVRSAKRFNSIERRRRGSALGLITRA